MDAPAPRIRLIASDLDGTLLGDDFTVSPRTRRALDAARSAGIEVVPVTARQPIGVRAIAAQAGFTSWSLCGNGAFAVHLATNEVLFPRTVDVETQRTLVTALRPLIPGLLHVSVRDGGETFLAEEEYADIAAEHDHKRAPSTMGALPLSRVIDGPSLKLVIRHPTIPPREILAAIDSLGLSGFEATVSGAPFVEIMAEGVTKATGLATLCAHLGIAQEEVIAFGDALNDVEMLRWAGRGVAMGNAEDAVIAAADEVTATNAEDGVAQVVERVLAGA